MGRGDPVPYAHGRAPYRLGGTGHYLHGWDTLWGAGRVIFCLHKTSHGIFRSAVKGEKRRIKVEKCRKIEGEEE